MDNISAAVTNAFSLLRIDLYRHLDQADFLAGSWETWNEQDLNTIRELIWDLVQIVRQMLREHQFQDTGDCRVCISAWPCSVVTTIHDLVMSPEHQLVALTCQAVNNEPSCGTRKLDAAS